MFLLIMLSLIIFLLIMLSLSVFSMSVNPAVLQMISLSICFTLQYYFLPAILFFQFQEDILQRSITFHLLHGSGSDQLSLLDDCDLVAEFLRNF